MATQGTAEDGNILVDTGGGKRLTGGMFLPTTRDEVTRRGWAGLDVILVTGDTYIDSPFVGVAVIGKCLVRAGYRVGILAQPQTDADFTRLGEPVLFWGVTSGCVDSMVANRTASGRRRRRDDFTPGGENNRRPDRAVTVYSNAIRRCFKQTVPIVLGGIEASLRRVAHYDFWSNRIRRSILFDAKADFLLYGMAESSVAALAGALVLGPRRGKFKADGTPNAIPGHHIPMAMVGCFILAFGWFGFNAGSTLAGGDLRIGVVAVNTMLASAAAAFTSMLYMWNRYGKPDISMIANGFLAGLVAITAPCAFVNSVAAVAIGAIAGIFLCLGVFFVERVMKIDDPVGAISVHGVNGAWGVLSVGLFADGTYGDGLNGVAGTVKGLFYGDASQFTAQLIGTATNIIFVFVIMYVFFKVLDKFVPLRVSEEMELAGLDHSEVAVNAYPEFNLNKTHR